MNDGPLNEDLVRMAQLDRLATGELADAARPELFAWLDDDRSRWRRCALVLLEARELDQAFDDLTNEVPQRSAPATWATTLAPSARRVWGGRLVLAVSLFVAFGLGSAVQRIRNPLEQAVVQQPQKHDAVATSPASQQDNRAPVSQKAPGAPQPDNRREGPPMVAASSPGMSGDPIPAYVRSQLERRGYRVESRRSDVSVVFPDGKHVNLPVDQVQFSYIGQRSY
jgi:anti-sigma factor RsiW